MSVQRLLPARQCVQVAFASFTDFGPLMALAVALHNIPEGLIVAGAARLTVLIGGLLLSL
jgi:zinc transporter ZupT